MRGGLLESGKDGLLTRVCHCHLRSQRSRQVSVAFAPVESTIAFGNLTVSELTQTKPRDQNYATTRIDNDENGTHAWKVHLQRAEPPPGRGGSTSPAHGRVSVTPVTPVAPVGRGSVPPRARGSAALYTIGRRRSHSIFVLT